MSENDFIVRHMTRAEVNLAMDWAAIEGWNPGIYDADCFYNIDPQGFFIGLLNGHPIGCISAVAYNNTFGFSGFYIVKPEFRGKNYGFYLARAALRYLRNFNIGLDGVLEKQENYKRIGFKLAHRNIRYKGLGRASSLHNNNIVPLSKIPINLLKVYDDMLSPASRESFLRCWVTQPESIALGALNEGMLQGYTVARKCRYGYKIGPLFANDPKVADDLFSTVIGSIPANTTFFWMYLN